MRTRRLIVGFVASAAMAAACSDGQASSENAAVWVLENRGPLPESSTSFAADVTRLACSGGVTGTVMAPTISVRDTDIIVTFTVSSLAPGSYTCVGGRPVRYVVEIGQPIGTRRLIDGACLPGAAAATTAVCDGGGVRSP